MLLQTSLSKVENVVRWLVILVVVVIIVVLVLFYLSPIPAPPTTSPIQQLSTGTSTIIHVDTCT